MDVREAWSSGEVGALLAQDEGAEGGCQFVLHVRHKGRQNRLREVLPSGSQSLAIPDWLVLVRQHVAHGHASIGFCEPRSESPT